MSKLFSIKTKTIAKQTNRLEFHLKLCYCNDVYLFCGLNKRYKLNCKMKLKKKKTSTYKKKPNIVTNNENTLTLTHTLTNSHTK